MEDLLRRPAWRVALVLLLALALLVGVASTPLFDQDEAAYAGFARGMRQTGVWALHSFTWSEMHRKPPLSLWLIAASTSLLGEHWWSVRLPAALSFAASCGLLWRVGGALFGQSRAALATVVLATSLAPVFGKLALVDPVLLLTETVLALGLLGLLAGWTRRGALAVGLGLALGLLAKGPAVVVFAGGMGLLLLLHPDRRRLTSIWLAGALCLSVLPLLAWGAAAWRADGGVTVRWMLDWYLLSRAGGQVLGQTGPPGVYLLSFGLFLWPWVAFLPAGLAELYRGLRRREAGCVGLAGWLLGGWILWELLPSKLPAYVLGATPALALLIAQAVLSLRPGRRPAALVRAGLGGLLLVSLGLGAALVWVGATLVDPGAMAGFLIAAAWVVAAGGGFALSLLRSRLSLGLAAGMASGPVLLGLIWTLLLPALRPHLHPTWTVAQTVSAMAPAGTPVVLADAWRLPSLPYYLGATGRSVELLPTAQAETLVARGGARVAVLPERPATLPVDARVRVVQGWIPDKGRPTRFVVVALRAAR